MATRLVDYLVRLETSPEEAVAFRKNPVAAMETAGLSEKHQAVLRSRNPGRIREAVSAEQPAPAVLCPVIRPF